MLKKRSAFTLAEVLITLGIIGIISVMVLPRMLRSMEDKVLITQTKHFYSLMSQTTKTYMANNGIYSLKNMIDCSQVRCTTDQKANTVQHMVETTLKVARKCERAKDCYTEVRIGDNAFIAIENMLHNSNAPAYALLDGYIVALSRESRNDDIRLVVDVNGQDAPNKLGRDIWFMYIQNDGTIRTAGSGVTTSNASDCDTNYAVCFGNFIKSGYKLYTSK